MTEPLAGRKLSILHVYKDYFPVLGGIENHVRLLAREQAARGHDVTVLVTSQSGESSVWQDGAVRVIQAGRLAHLASTPISLSLFTWMRRLRPDVTHLHFPYPVGEVAHLLFGHGRTVISYHADIVRQKAWLKLYEPVLWRVLRRADRILPSNEPYIESSPYLRHLRSKITVIPLGIPIENFDGVPAGEVAAVRARYARPDRPLLVAVGRLRYYKGLEVAIAAMKEIEATLLLVGSGPMESEWRAVASRLGVADRVVFAGEVPDRELPAHFRAADVYVSSSTHRSEAYGLTLLEAMASGKPVISTELGSGTSFINQHGVTGLVVPPSDVRALSLAVRRLLDSPEERLRMGQAGRTRVEREFTLEVMVDRILRVYAEVLGVAAGPTG